MPAKEGGLVTELQDLLLNVQKGFSEFWACGDQTNHSSLPKPLIQRIHSYMSHSQIVGEQ